MPNEWLTKDVAGILDVSVPTVRNYAKALERYNHEFQKRKQARVWTDTEISIIREATDLFKNSDYTLENCFQYAIAKRNVGEDKAKELLKAPVNYTQEAHNPQLQQMEQNILQAISSVKDDLTPDSDLLEYQDREQDYIEQVNALKSELSASQNENEQLKQQLEHVKSLNMWQFRKWKQER